MSFIYSCLLPLVINIICSPTVSYSPGAMTRRRVFTISNLKKSTQLLPYAVLQPFYLKPHSILSLPCRIQP